MAENPFLEKFYREGSRHALATQLFFLFQRVEQLRGLTQFDFFERHVVCDFLLDKDPLFARLTLSDDEYALYRNIFDHVKPQTPEEYLERLAESYSRAFYDYDAAPLLIVNTEALNPVDRESDFDLLLERIAAMRSRREFFNIA